MTTIFLRLGVLIAVFASIFLVTQFLLASYMARRAQTTAVNKRLTLLRSGLSAEAVADILRKGGDLRLSPNAGLLERLNFRFIQTVRLSGISLEPRAVLGICLIAASALTALLLFFAWTAKLRITVGVIELCVCIAIAAGIVVPLLLLSRRADKRRKRMQEQFPVALDIFTRALKAGHPIAAAIDLLTQEMEDPLGSEFGMVADEVAYGAELTDALQNMAERWDLDDIRMFVVSLSLQSETGGNLAEILESLSTVIRERASLYLKVRALSSEGRMSGWMLTVLPVFTLLSVFAVSPQFYFDVAADPIFIYGFTGLIILYFIGVMVIRRMIDLKV